MNMNIPAETGTYALHGVAGQLDLTENEDAETTSDSQHTDRSTDISEMKGNEKLIFYSQFP